MTSADALARPSTGLSARTVPIADPGVALVDLVPDGASFAWSRRGQGLIGWGVAASVRTSGPDRFDAARRWWRTLVATALVRDEVREPGTGLVAFASFAFAPDSASDSMLTVPRHVLGCRSGRWWLTSVGGPDELPPPPPPLRPVAVTAPGELRFADGARTPAEWEAAVAAAVGEIGAGALDKVVLARDLEVRAAAPIDARWVLRRLAARYPSCFAFAVDGLVGATPELLVRVDGRLVTSRVLAGTIRRTGSLARDEALAGSLARSSKDLEEHEYAVASVAETLAAHCTGTNVPEAPFVLHLPNVMHLATDVTGVVGDGSTALDLAAALHPTAAVCGTPRAAAADAIGRLEGMDRGRYAGPTGWIGADGTGEFGIALRCGAVDPEDARRIRLFAGCGIVADSDPEAELAESIAKLIPMRDALQT